MSRGLGDVYKRQLEIVPYMFYCYLMAACAIIFILFFSGRTKSAG